MSNSAQQQFVIEGVTCINAEDFQVAGTTIYGSLSLVLSSLVQSVQINDLDEDIIIEFELSEFAASLEDPQSGFYDTASSEFLTSPIIISASADGTSQQLKI